MALGKQAKVLSGKQISAMDFHIGKGRNGLRNRVAFSLSIRAGLRAKEIANLTWEMLVQADGEIGSYIGLTNSASKGLSGRQIPINKALRELLVDWYQIERARPFFDPATSYVFRTERRDKASAQVIVNLFHRWYREIGLVGCSSHSGRRTFITNAAKKISLVGGSIRDVQILAGHSSLSTTQRYIDGDSEARTRIVDLI